MGSSNRDGAVFSFFGPASFGVIVCGFDFWFFAFSIAVPVGAAVAIGAAFESVGVLLADVDGYEGFGEFDAVAFEVSKDKMW